MGTQKWAGTNDYFENKNAIVVFLVEPESNSNLLFDHNKVKKKTKHLSFTMIIFEFKKHGLNFKQQIKY